MTSDYTKRDQEYQRRSDKDNIHESDKETRKRKNNKPDQKEYENQGSGIQEKYREREDYEILE